MRLYQRRPGGVWHYEFRFKRKQYRGTTDEANKKAALLVAKRERERVRSGEPGGLPEEPARLTIRAALIDYGEEQRRRQRTTQHRAELIGYLGRFADDAGITHLDELDAPAIERGLAALADRSPRTQNKVLSYVRAFCKWARKTGRMVTDPSRDVERVQPLPQLEQRRALTPEELAALTTDQSIHASRRLVYLVAAYTGLRRNELATLEPHHLDLERAELTVEAKHAKNRKAVTLPLADVVVEAWRAWLAAPEWYDRSVTRTGGRVLPPPPNKQTFFQDLWRVGILQRERAEGKRGRAAWRYIHSGPGWRLDFHCLRTTFITSLARAGVPLAAAQQLARHSDPKLTSNTYTRFDGSDRRETIRRLQDALRVEDESAHKKRTS